MYKAKLILLSLTWVWLKLNTHLKTNELFGVCVQNRTQKPNSSLKNSKIEFSTDKPTQEHMCKVKLILKSLTWVCLKFNFQLKMNAGAHVQSQTHFFDFDLSLTKLEKEKSNIIWSKNQTHWSKFDLSLSKIQFSARNPSRTACAKANWIF